MTAALVTGATGFVGGHLVDALLARGYRVRCTVRRSSDLTWLEGKRYEPVGADLRDSAGLARAVEGVDVVFHVAGVLSAATLEKFRQGNCRATVNLLQAACAARVPRFVYVSSLAATGPSTNGTPLTEGSPCRPVSLYGRSKLEAEREVSRRCGEMGVVIVRPPAVYGPRDRNTLDLFKLVAGGISPQIGGPKVASIIHVEDLVRGMAACGEHPLAVGEVFFFANDRAYGFSELLRMIAEEVGKKPTHIYVPDGLVRFLGSIAGWALPLLGKGGLFTHDKAVEMTQKAWVCSAGKARQVLGWEPKIPICDGLRSTLAWYREKGWV